MRRESNCLLPPAHLRSGGIRSTNIDASGFDWEGYHPSSTGGYFFNQPKLVVLAGACRFGMNRQHAAECRTHRALRDMSVLSTIISGAAFGSPIRVERN